ncbi:MAG: hypothetical protein RIQ47_1024, partial [Bacteroidota bacterium]
RGASRRDGSGSRGGDRSSKPGFRPKGNNSGRPRRVSDNENRQERGERGEAASRSPRPRISRVSGDDRPRRTYSDREEKPARRSYGDREEKPARRSYGDREEKPVRRSYGEREEKPARRSYGEREEKPARRSYGDRDEKPARRSYGDREEKPARRSYGDREEKPARRSYGDREEKPARRSYGDRDEKPARRSYGDREEKPTRRTYADREEKPTRRAPGSRIDEERSERPVRRSSDREEGRSYTGRSSHRDTGDRPRFSKDSSRRSFGNDKPKFRKSHASKKVTGSDDGTTRLNKYIANCGICSRREADELIKAGVISVNGTVITEMGFKVNPGDEVRYNNSLLKGERPVYIILNKPKDFITTVEDPGNRRTVMELISGACKERVYPVGRLDRNTTGVLLFTNDGDLARKLMHPSFHVQKVYHVTLEKSLKPEEMEKIADGMHLEDGPIKVDDIAYAGDGTDRKEVGVEIHSGRNRIVRRIFEHLGHEVIKLDRTVFAGLTKKDLPRGRWRFLTPMEVANLKMMVGDKRIKETV